MKALISTISLLILTSISYAQDIERRFVYFDYNQFVLTSEGKAVIDDILLRIKPEQITQLELYGHTDSEGDDQGNQQLSQNRITAVQQYFLTKGIPGPKIRTEAFGESRPVTGNGTENDRQRNRRVEIVVTYTIIQEVVAVEEPQPVIKQNPVATMSRRMPATNQNVQVFTGSGKKEIEVTGAKGTIVKFPAKSFFDQSGEAVTSEVTIKLIEVYTKSEMINSSIQTTCNGALLESGGMIYVQATSNGSPLSLVNNSEYTVTFPTTNQKRGMEIFYGDTAGTQINWQRGRVFVTKGDYFGANQAELDKYVFNSSKLGWINCDRFTTATAKTDLQVDVADTSGVSFCLVFKSINSVMNISSKDKGIQFLGVPLGEEAIIVAFKKTETETYYASKTIVIEKNRNEMLVMEQMTEAQFQERIKEFD